MKRLGQRGVTLLELMIAMLLLATALIGLAAALPYAMYGVLAGGFQTTATLLAQEALERVKAGDYATLSSLTMDGATVSTDCSNVGNFHTVSGYSGFSRCVAVNPGQPTATTTQATAVVEFSGSVPNPIWRTTLTTIRTN